MNKDIVGLIYCILYRLKFDEIANEYREKIVISEAYRDVIFYRPTGWQLNYREIRAPRAYFDTTVYNIIERKCITIKPRKY